MKKAILGILCLTLSFAHAQNNLGEKKEPQCGEPCATCPGGIKLCAKTRSGDSREVKMIDNKTKSAVKKSSKTSRQ